MIRMKMMEAIYAPLDEGIADVVRLLRKNSINTFASCEGGEGHAYSKPTVRIHPRHTSDMQPAIDKISEILSLAGYGGYYLKQCHLYQGDSHPWENAEHFIELEFWADHDFAKAGLSG